MGPLSSCLSILIYHRVVPDPDTLMPGEVCAFEFDWQMAVLARWFNVLPLAEAVGRLRQGRLPVRAACVTFDDGYANNATVALPILLRHKVAATFFIATAFLDGGRMFNDTVIETVRGAHGAELDGSAVGLNQLSIATDADRRQAIESVLKAVKYLPQQEREQRVEALHAAAGGSLPSDLMMTAEQVRHLQRNGMEIGAHTATHPILSRLDADSARSEIVAGRRRLEELTGAAVRLFAYPNGRPGVDYGRDHVVIARELGFEAAVSTASGVATARSDPFQLPRFTPWDRTPVRFALRLFQNTFRTTPELV